HSSNLILMKKTILLFFVLVSAFTATAQIKTFTLDDTLRGTITPERAWWDLLHYDLNVEVDVARKHFKGTNVILYKALEPNSVLQVDLQEPLDVTAAYQRETELRFTKRGANA